MDAFPPSATTPSRSASQRFMGIAALTILVYAGVWLFYSNPAWCGPRLNRELLVWPVTLSLLYLYWAGYQALNDPTVSRRWIWMVGLIIAAIAIVTPPFHSTDVFGYINRGWQQVQYGLNPYVYTVDHIPHWESDPMITDHWVNNPSPYGFLYLLIAKGLTLLGAGSKAATLLIFKLGNGVVHACTAAVIWLSAKQLNKKNPDQPIIRPDMALYLYLWNPLVLIHGLANGHNDLWMGFFVTLSAYFAIIGAWVWMLPALMAATLIKYAALVILPLALLFLIKQKAWISLGLGIILALAVFLLTGLPYLPDWQQFHLAEINRNAFVSHGSLHSLLFSSFKSLTRLVIPDWHPYREAVRTLLKNTLLLLFAAFYGGLMLQRFRQAQYTTPQWIQDALLVMAVLIGLISLKFYPWYLGMFFPLTLLLPEGHWLRRFVIVLSGAQLFSITFIGQAHLLNFLVMTGLPIGWAIWRFRKQAKLQNTASGATTTL